MFDSLSTSCLGLVIGSMMCNESACEASAGATAFFAPPDCAVCRSPLVSQAQCCILLWTRAPKDGSSLVHGAPPGALPGAGTPPGTPWHAAPHNLHADFGVGVTTVPNDKPIVPSREPPGPSERATGAVQFDRHVSGFCASRIISPQNRPALAHRCWKGRHGLRRCGKGVHRRSLAGRIILICVLFLCFLVSHMFRLTSQRRCQRHFAVVRPFTRVRLWQGFGALLWAGGMKSSWKQPRAR